MLIFFHSRRSARAESSFHAMLHDDLNSRVNYHDDTGSEQRLISSDDAATICQGSPSNSCSLDSSSYRCPSMVLQSLTDRNPQLECCPYYGRMMNYATPLNHHVNSNEFSSSSSWSKFPHEFIKNSPPKQQQPNQLHFSNNTPFWNATAETINDVKPNFYPSSQNQFLGPTFGEKPNCSYFPAKVCTTILFTDIFHLLFFTSSVYVGLISCVFFFFFQADCRRNSRFKLNFEEKQQWATVQKD